MRVRRRWLLGTVSGFAFGLFVALALLGSGAFALDSPWLVWMPVIGLAVGLAGSLWAPRPPVAVTPLARATMARASSTPVAPASPEIWSEPAPEAPDAAAPITDEGPGDTTTRA
jgi:hypothetical protein